MIVRFTTWRHRTEVYRARKKSKSVKIRLDLTKLRLNILEKAQTLIDESGGDCKVAFVFADINCNLVAKMKDGKFIHFRRLEEINTLL